MKPACAVFSKNFVPIDFSRLQLRNGRVPAIVTSEGRSHAEAALGEVEAVPGRETYAIVFDPADKRLVHASLIDEILKQPPNRIVREGGHDSGVQAETAFQSTSDVVFSAALANVEGARGDDATVARVE